MLATIKTAISLLGLFLLTHSLALGADLFQWTDARGVIHFTDRLDAVPETVRQSASLIVRPGFFSPPTSSESGPTLPGQSLVTPPPEPLQDSQLITNDFGQVPLSYTPQETIVVTNSGVQPWCARNKCGFAFRPRFNGSQHPHRPLVVGATSTLRGARGAIVLGARNRR